MVTRRGLLAAGAGERAWSWRAAALPEEPPPDAELLAPSLAAALALAGAYERAGGRIGRALAAREREHADRLRAAGARRAREAPAAPDGAPLEAALALEQAALRAHVRAVGLVRALPAPRARRPSCWPTTRATSTVLRERLGLAGLPSAFPDGRDA